MSPLLEDELKRTKAALTAPEESGLGFDTHEWLERAKVRPAEDGDRLLICVDAVTEGIIAKRHAEFMAAWEAQQAGRG